MLPQLLQQLARHLLTAALFGGGLAVAVAHAADVEFQLSDRVSATADFRPGKTGKPAVLVLHGFLQTREFGIVKSIADTLADEGYTGGSTPWEESPGPAPPHPTNRTIAPSTVILFTGFLSP